MASGKILIATRGSALALAQSNVVLAQCRATFPELQFELRVIKTTGDKLQTASLAQEGSALPKGLFTKELEVELLNNRAHLAVHSLKDLPTELPQGLKLGATGKREDARDVLIYRDAEFLRQAALDSKANALASLRGFPPALQIKDLPDGAIVATSSTRRRAQLLEQNPGLKVPDIRGNVLTRLVKFFDNPDLDGTLLAIAGLRRLNYQVTSDGMLVGEGVPKGLRGTLLSPEVMLPCVGQGAVGIEIRAGDERLEKICERLNDLETFQCTTAERAFLAGMGGGCQSPVAAFARVAGKNLKMDALSFASVQCAAHKRLVPWLRPRNWDNNSRPN